MFSFVAYLGLVLFLVGAVTIVRPLHWLRIASRRHALGVLLAGAALATVGLWTPPKLEHAPADAPSRLDEMMPVYHFHERHETTVRAPIATVYGAVRAVTAREIRFFRLLTWIRSPRWGSEGEPSILNPPADEPILDVATKTGFRLLADEPPREIVTGILVFAPSQPAIAFPSDWARLALPGYVKAAMSFRLEALGEERTRVLTETRVYATDERARRRFTPYWRLIYPGSSLLRSTWLAAIRQRAEAGNP